jgi:heptosyltransferase-2
LLREVSKLAGQYSSAQIETVRLRPSLRNCWGLLSPLGNRPIRSADSTASLLVGAFRYRHIITYLFVIWRLKPSRSLFATPCGYSDRPVACAYFTAVRRLNNVLGAEIEGAVAVVVRAAMCLLFPRRKMRQESVLAVVSGHVGDVIISTPALRALRELYPTAHIIAVARGHGVQMLRLCPHIDRLLMFVGNARIWQHIGLAYKLAGQNIVASVNISYPPTCGEALIGYVAGARERFGPRSHALDVYPRLGRPFTTLVPRVSTELRQWFLDPVRAMGSRNYDDRVECCVCPRAREDAARLLGRDDDRALVLVHPGCSAVGGAKRWPASNFAQIIDEISERWRARVVLTGVASEASLLYHIAHSCRSCVEVMAGRLTLDQMIALIERSDLIVTNDTGPMHIALALNTPLVGIFGPTDPDAVVGKSAQAGPCRLLRGHLPCPPRTLCKIYQQTIDERDAPSWYCGDAVSVCTRAVSVAEVLTAVDELMCQRAAVRI